jgi:tripartite-type tricarboxylate transporter receptor subunit TctC
MQKKTWRFVAIIAALALTAAAGHTASPELYKGKTLRIIVGTAAGGGFDTYSRVIARHIGKHLPGNPSIVVHNMPGAGHLIAANHLYRVAKPDGYTMGNFIGGLLLRQVLGQPGIEFDALKFEYVGVPLKDTWICALTKASGITSMEKWVSAKTPVKLGGTGPGANTDDIPAILKASLGLPIQLVTGYKGTADIRLAAESGELAGGCWSWDSINATWSKALESGDVVVVVQMTTQPHPDLPKVPLAINFARTEDERQLIQLGTYDPAAMNRLYVLPPGTPKDVVQIVRKAFMDTLNDPDFKVDAKKSKLDIEPMGGEELAKTVAALFKLKPAMVAKLKEALK